MSEAGNSNYFYMDHEKVVSTAAGIREHAQRVIEATDTMKKNNTFDSSQAGPHPDWQAAVGQMHSQLNSFIDGYHRMGHNTHDMHGNVIATAHSYKELDEKISQSMRGGRDNA